MAQTVEALFDGTVLRPEEPLTLEANTRVRITVEILPPREDLKPSFLKTAQSLRLDGPADGSANPDLYLYGSGFIEEAMAAPGFVDDMRDALQAFRYADVGMPGTIGA